MRPPDGEPDCAELRRMASNCDLMRLIRPVTVPAPRHIHSFRAARSFRFRGTTRRQLRLDFREMPEQAGNRRANPLWARFTFLPTG